MNGKCLLDTNVAIEVLNNVAAVRAKFANAVEVMLSTTELGELYFGAFNSARSVANAAKLEAFAADLPVIGCDIGTARWYGQIRQRLLDKGRPIPDNDIWIAATAIQHGLTVVTRDAHFQQIDGLAIESW